MKTCSVCGEDKPTHDFECSRGQCKVCRAKYFSGRKKTRTVAEKRKATEYSKQWRLKNPNYRQLVDYPRRKESHRLKAVLYRKNNPEKHAASSRKRQCAKANRTPNWLTVDDFWLMQEAYSVARMRTNMTGVAWEVDHIIPLRGSVVSGLHVPLNLRVILRSENRSKRTKYVIS